MRSEFGKVSWREVLHSLIVAFFSSAFVAATSVLSASAKFKDINWQTILIAGVSGAIGYIGKKFFTNSNGEPLKTEK